MDERCLVMADDPELVDALLRLAAAAGVEVQHAADVDGARPWWTAARMVLLEPTAARRLVGAGFARRDGVVLAQRGDPPGWVWQLAVTLGADQVVSLPAAEARLVGALADARGAGDDRSGPVLAVVGARGGAGASTLACAVALAVARAGADALLVDCDPLGGGLDVLLGIEQVPGLRWPELVVSGGRIQAGALHSALPHASPPRAGSVAAGRSGAGRLAVLSCDRRTHGPAPAAVSAVVEAGRRDGDTVVCDLPRHLTAAARAALACSDLTVLVVPADLRSCAAACRVATALSEHARTVGVVARGPSPGGITARDVARSVGLPLLDSMRPQDGLDRGTERGRPPGTRRGPLTRTAGTVLGRLAEVAPGERARRPVGAAR